MEDLILFFKHYSLSNGEHFTKANCLCPVAIPIIGNTVVLFSSWFHFPQSQLPSVNHSLGALNEKFQK